MQKKYMKVCICIVVILLAGCTIYALRYEKMNTLRVSVAKPQWTEDRQLVLPDEAVINEIGVWTVKNTESIWGTEQILVVEEVRMEIQKDGTVLVPGLSTGIETLVVISCEGELQPGIRVIIENEFEG